MGVQHLPAGSRLSAAPAERLVKARVAFVLISKLYRQMYANTGIATDSARVARSTRWANLLGRGCRLLFLAQPMPDLAMPEALASAMPAPQLISLTTMKRPPSESSSHSARLH